MKPIDINDSPLANDDGNPKKRITMPYTRFKLVTDWLGYGLGMDWVWIGYGLWGVTPNKKQLNPVNLPWRDPFGRLWIMSSATLNVKFSLAAKMSSMSISSPLISPVLPTGNTKGGKKKAAETTRSL